MNWRIGVAAAALALSLAPVAEAQNGYSPRTVVVNMVDRSATQYAFEPAELTVHPGDTVRFVQTGAMPHNVQFTKSPAGSSLGGAQMGPFLTTLGQTYQLVIDGRFGAGAHEFVCTPHVSMGMRGTMTVSPPAPVATR